MITIHLSTPPMSSRTRGSLSSNDRQERKGKERKEREEKKGEEKNGEGRGTGLPTGLDWTGWWNWNWGGSGKGREERGGEAGWGGKKGERRSEGLRKTRDGENGNREDGCWIGKIDRYVGWKGSFARSL